MTTLDEMDAEIRRINCRNRASLQLYQAWRAWYDALPWAERLTSENVKTGKERMTAFLNCNK